MDTKVRVNANIERGTYEEFQKILKSKRITITKFLEGCIARYLWEQRYSQDKSAFDELAKEPATRELLSVEKECSHDGLQ